MSEIKILKIDPAELKQPFFLELNESKSSWIKIQNIPENLKNYALENFDTFFNHHPNLKGKMINYLKDIDAHRYYKSYMNTPKLNIDFIKEKNSSYMFSNSCENLFENNLPEPFQIFLDYLNKDELEKYNQSVINWYENGNDYLPFHQDWEHGKKENSDVTTITLMKNDDDNYRNFIVKPNKKYVKDYKYDQVEILTRHGTQITMGGDCQQNFRHGVPKMLSNDQPRISLTFRNYNEC